MYIYSYLFCLYQCKDYCHRVTTQLQEVVILQLQSGYIINNSTVQNHTEEHILLIRLSIHQIGTVH